MSLVSIDKVHKYYGDNHVLKGVDLRIKAGEVVSIIGRSGSGKSTLLRCLNGLETYEEGAIVVDRQAVENDDYKLRLLSRSVGMVFQSFNLFPHKTVGENVMLAPQLVLKKSKQEAKQQAEELLEKVGLADKFDAYLAISLVDSSSASLLLVPWLCLLRCFCVTRSPPLLTQNWWVRCLKCWSNLRQRV